jgi:hypothetical protein
MQAGAVQSSVTAKPFYAKRGFKIVREGFFGEEPTILMSKDISEPFELRARPLHGDALKHT